MKRIIFRITNLLSLAGIMLFFVNGAFAQDDIVREARELSSFNQIKVGGAFEVALTQGSPQMVEVESRQKALPDIITEVHDNTLVITSKGIKNNTPMKIFITVPQITWLEVHGAAELKGTGIIKGEELNVNVSGAAEVDLELEVGTLVSEVSGAADLDVSGTAVNHQTNVSGAATLNAREFKVKYTTADVSGAATANVNTEDLVGNTSGSGEIYDEDRMVDMEEYDDDENYIVKVDEDSDTTYIKVPGTAIVITEGDDSVKVRVGNRVLVVDEDGDVYTKKCHEPKFNGHWAGFDIGFNGYVTPDFDMNFPKESEYMDLRMEKSIMVNLNFFEQNIPFSKNQKWGMLTGLGLSFNNYMFMHPTRLNMESSALIGYLDQDISIRKSKLTAMYLTLPVLFEFQTAPAYHKNGFHINTGVIIGARLSSHTKKYYNDLNKEFNVTLYNPETGQYDVVYTAISPEDPKAHHYGDWFLQPFRFDASVRIGWNFLNFWANYSLNTMFRKEKGPELYPWSAGITLVCF